MVKKPSNPFKYFISGNDEDEFTFAERVNGKPFYICVQTEHYIPISVIVMANDEDDAKQLFKDALRFGLEKRKSRRAMLNEDLTSRYTSCIETSQSILSAIDSQEESEYKVLIIPAPMGQFFKVGWADNDTIL